MDSVFPEYRSELESKGWVLSAFEHRGNWSYNARHMELTENLEFGFPSGFPDTQYQFLKLVEDIIYKQFANRLIQKLTIQPDIIVSALRLGDENAVIRWDDKRDVVERMNERIQRLWTGGDHNEL